MAVADTLNLNLWFPSFSLEEMMPRAISVMRQFHFSAERPVITYLSVHPFSWNEPTILEQRFSPGVDPQAAVEVTSDLLHDDYAYMFEAFWDLWSLDETAHDWTVKPQQVKFIVHGSEFEEGTYKDDGHIQVDFGIDSPFLQEGVKLTPFNEARVRANVQKLVEFTNKVEKNAGISGRVLWSESEENLAQKLVARLQKVQ
jgi:hypothetical protein